MVCARFLQTGRLLILDKHAVGYIHSMESFGSADGPGLRFVVFLAGCSFRCLYCHNPDTWNMAMGKEYHVDKILEKAIRYRPFWGDTGGITVSGGEPLLQMDFVIELFKRAKELGVHTTLDTCGGPFTRQESFMIRFRELMRYTDLILLDIKQMSNRMHIELTGYENKNILDLARQLSEWEKPVWIRHVLVPTINDDEFYLRRLAYFLDTLTNVMKVEVIPYHSLGAYKWKQLGLEYPLEGIKPPTNEQIARAKNILGVS